MQGQQSSGRQGRIYIGDVSDEDDELEESMALTCFLTDHDNSIHWSADNPLNVRQNTAKARSLHSSRSRVPCRRA